MLSGHRASHRSWRGEVGWCHADSVGRRIRRIAVFIDFDVVLLFCLEIASERLRDSARSATDYGSLHLVRLVHVDSILWCEPHREGNIEAITVVATVSFLGIDSFQLGGSRLV